MKIAICDDDNMVMKQLEKYLAEYFKQNGLKQPLFLSYSTGEELLENASDADIIFLDIELPYQNGITIGQKLKEQNPKLIIFIITSYEEYLDDAMRFQVFRYLSKPIDKNRLFRNLEDAVRRYVLTEAKIGIETKDGVHTIHTSDIIFIEAKEKAVTIYTEQENFISIRPMNYLEEKLSLPRFFRTHRSFIVNLDYVSFFDHSLIHLCGGTYKAYLTRRKYAEFKAAYMLYLESIR